MSSKSSLPTPSLVLGPAPFCPICSPDWAAETTTCPSFLTLPLPLFFDLPLISRAPTAARSSKSGATSRTSSRPNRCASSFCVSYSPRFEAGAGPDCDLVGGWKPRDLDGEVGEGGAAGLAGLGMIGGRVRERSREDGEGRA